MSQAAKPPAKRAVKSIVLDYIEKHGTTLVDEAAFAAIRKEAALGSARGKTPSDLYLLDILSAAGIEIDRRLGGVPVDLRGRIRTGTLADARESLAALAREYAAAGDAARAEDIRRAVRNAKDRLKFLLGRKLSADKRRVKEEVLCWMLVWLENPLVFESWVALRLPPRRHSSDDRPASTA